MQFKKNKTYRVLLSSTELNLCGAFRAYKDVKVLRLLKYGTICYGKSCMLTHGRCASHKYIINCVYNIAFVNSDR